MVTFITTELVSEQCWAEGCGVTFGMTAERRQIMRERGQTFYCLNGHALRFGESKADKLQRELDAEKKRTQNVREYADSLVARIEEKQRSLVALRGHQTRLKKRIATGKCPCCHEELKDVARHMASQHPCYAEAVS